MPYKNEYSARLIDPFEFDDFRRVDNSKDNFGWLPEGVSVVLGIKDGKSKIQSLRFKKDKWDEDQIKKWLQKNNFENYKEFENDISVNNFKKGINSWQYLREDFFKRYIKD